MRGHHIFREKRIETTATHGTRLYTAARSPRVWRRDDFREAVGAAKRFVTIAMPRADIGSGNPTLIASPCSPRWRREFWGSMAERKLKIKANAIAAIING